MKTVTLLESSTHEKASGGTLIYCPGAINLEDDQADDAVAFGVAVYGNHTVEEAKAIKAAEEAARDAALAELAAIGQEAETAQVEQPQPAEVADPEE